MSDRDLDDFVDWLMWECNNDSRMIVVLALIFVTIFYCILIFSLVAPFFILAFVLVLEDRHRRCEKWKRLKAAA